MTQKQILHECPNCHSLRTTRDVHGFRCLSCSSFFPRSGNGELQIKKETLKVLEQARKGIFTEEEVDNAENKINE